MEADLRDELRRLEVQTGRSFLAGDSRAHLIEGFSHLARNYGAGHHADLNFGEKLRHFLNLLAEKMAAVFTLAGDLKRLSTEGGLSPELETALRESVGFGEAGMESKYDADRSVEVPGTSVKSRPEVTKEGGNIGISLSVALDRLEGSEPRAFKAERLNDPSPQSALEYWNVHIVGKSFRLPNGLTFSPKPGHFFRFVAGGPKKDMTAAATADEALQKIASGEYGESDIKGWERDRAEQLPRIAEILEDPDLLVEEPHAAGKPAFHFIRKINDKKHIVTIGYEAVEGQFAPQSFGLRNLSELGKLVGRVLPPSPASRLAASSGEGPQEANRQAESSIVVQRDQEQDQPGGGPISFSIAPIGPGAREIVSAPEVLSSKASPFSGVTATTPREWRPVWAAWLKANKKEWVGEGPVQTPEGPIAITNQTADHVRSVRVGERANLHFEAATRIRDLLAKSVLAYVETPKDGEHGASEIHRRYAWMKFGDGETRHVLLTVKRWNEDLDADTDTAYALEAIEVGGVADGNSPSTLSDDKADTGNAEDNLASFRLGIKPEHRK